MLFVMEHSSKAETGSSISEQVQKTVGKEMPTSLSPERMERIERLHKKYEDWVRRGIVEPPKYIPKPTPEEFAIKHKIGVF